MNQKELFERVSRDPGDPLSASRSFLAFVDESLDLLRAEPLKPGTWWHRFEDARDKWVTATQDLQKLRNDLSQLPSVQAQIVVLEGQINAFDSDEAKSRREHNDTLAEESRRLDEAEESARSGIQAIVDLGQSFARRGESGADSSSAAFAVQLEGLERIKETIAARLNALGLSAAEDLATWRREVEQSEWSSAVKQAAADSAAYVEELREKGVDGIAYDELKQTLREQLDLERSLRERETQLSTAEVRAAEGWVAIRSLLDERRATRARLLETVSNRSGRLRFELNPHADTVGWTRRVRDLIGLRADGYLEEVPALASWLWGDQQADVREQRWKAWREGLSAGNLGDIGSAGSARLRQAWQERLESLEGTVRLLLAAEIPDDVVNMSFLKDGGSSANLADWQSITQGSPGQRTAAMLGFVLHHGDEPLVLDQPEDDLDTEWISSLVVRELRQCRWTRQVIVATHNANIPVNGDAEKVIVLENEGGVLRVRETDASDGTGTILHTGAIEKSVVREDIQKIMEGGIAAFVQREKKYNNEVNVFKRV